MASLRIESSDVAAPVAADFAANSSSKAGDDSAGSRRNSSAWTVAISSVGRWRGFGERCSDEVDWRARIESDHETARAARLIDSGTSAERFSFLYFDKNFAN